MKWKHLSSRSGDLPMPPGSRQQTLCLVLDADRDGQKEFVLACRGQEPALVWYRPAAQGWDLYVIEDGSLPIEAGGVVRDVDGDGYPDIIAGEDHQGANLYWWENPGPDFSQNTPWRRHVIKEGGACGHHDQIVGDFDGDGRPELVFWNQGAESLNIAKFPEDPKSGPWPYTSIWHGAGEGLAKGDIDGDGRIELLAGGKWFKHRGGLEFDAYAIDPAQTHPRIAVADLNGDKRLEVVMVPGDGVGRLKWYSRLGDPTRTENWTGHDLLEHDVNHGHSLAIADFTRDGQFDIFCAEMAQWTEAATRPDNPNATMWILKGDGKGGFTPIVVARGVGVHEAKVGDIDRHSRPSIIAKPYCWDAPRIDLWINGR